ncbi:MAG: amidohydrolase [Deltaproteobacteria bacterium]|nr:amidohydrolase [Deltaproteobacteria bacterium]
MGSRWSKLVLISLMSWMLAAPSFAASAPVTGRVTADVILYNGKVMTVDSRFTVAQAVAITGDRFLAAGKNQEVLALARPATRRIDLRGKTVVPGFVDAHNHIDSIGWSRIHFAGSRSIADVVKVVADEVGKKKPGEWVISGRAGGAPGPEKLPAILKERRNPNRWELDSVSPDNPVWLYAPHVSIVNSYLLKLAGIDKNTADPSGGTIGRDPKTGEPTGVLTERAIRLISKIAPKPTYQDMLSAVQKAVRHYHSKGITSVKAEGVSEDGLRALMELREKGQLTLRVSASLKAPDLGLPTKEIETWLKSYEATIASRRGVGDELLRIEGAGEFGIDGGTGSGSAFQRFQYVGAAGKRSFGDQKVTQEKFTEVSLLCAKYNFRMNIHASGGAAVDLTLNGWEEVNRQIPIGGLRWNLIHAQAPSKINYEQIKRLGATVVTDPVKMTSTVVGYYGKEFSETLNPLREWLDHGVRIALGSDAEVGAPDPLLWIYMASTRSLIDGTQLGLNQKITPKEALIASTINGSYVTFEEKKKGSIEAGKLADLVVLDRDLLSVPANEIKEIKVLVTMVAGKVVYETK